MGTNIRNTEEALGQYEDNNTLLVLGYLVY